MKTKLQGLNYINHEAHTAEYEKYVFLKEHNTNQKGKKYELS